ncbi:shikimate dehydrogenase family protein [Kibdelosporangium phytohabitans]|uniref:Shikimate dehydrogenase n=1 Tax=Kibdelosporangium phytohabitans TaxID=860235 RepID=A0A0N9HYA0_9PSEU|nr:saccharopine dehydrogenase NADP-binding domain-containing protein [Kibdelosporangium phytohabitans]ALG07254.1 shikimate dehydrogenase [Kibdelosporangium phytohabitans]
MGFVGVSTGESSIRRIFPVWAEILGLPTRELTGFDLPVGAARDDYRDVITRIAADPEIPGALITTHKIGVYQSARDLFDELDPDATRFGEISSLSKKDGKLTGHAFDPVTAGLAMEEFIPPGHFGSTGGELLCLGAGGAGTAIVWYLAHRADMPRRIFCTDRSNHKLAALRAMLRRERVRVHVDTVPVTGPVDGLIELLPPGSMIVNATGMGKDTPGSPISAGCEFPPGCLIWEINYRGSLGFLATARARAAADELTVVDGWRYFVHGWAQVIADVFDVKLTGEQMRRLSDAAVAVR